VTDEGDRPRRPVGEVITLVITATIAACMVAGVVGVIVIRIWHPDEPVGPAASSLGTLLSVLGGYVLGERRSRPNGRH